MKSVQYICLFLLSCSMLTSCDYFSETEEPLDRRYLDSLENANKKPIIDTVATVEPKEKEVYVSPEIRVQRLIMALPEVKKTVLKFQGKKRIYPELAQKPSEDDPYYSVSVVDDDTVSGKTYYQFYIDPKTNKIRIYDSGEDRLVPIEEWRKMHQNEIQP